MSIEGQLRETSDILLAALQELARLEIEKRSLTPGDPRLPELAARIEDIGEQVLGATAHQRELAELSDELVEQGSPLAPERPIEQSVRTVTTILREWRAVEKQRLEADPRSAQGRELTARADALHDEYQRAVRQAGTPDR